MNDQEFYAKLASFDRGMADRWKTATGGKLSARIGMDAIVTMLAPIGKGQKITSSQAQAIAMLWGTELTNDGQYLLRKFINAAYDQDWFFKGSARPLIASEDLKPLEAALGMANVGKIKFTSPRTLLTYTPDLYNGIKWLVREGKIRVFEVDAGELLTREGNYRTDLNRLILYKEYTPMAGLRTMIIVHEATHAIQDWRNVRSTVKLAESDAYIAGAVAALTVNKDFKYLEYPALRDAAELVMAGKATQADTTWTKAYDDVVKAVEVDLTYAETKNKRFDTAINEPENEAELFNEALKHFKMDIVLRELGKTIPFGGLYELSSEAGAYQKRALAHRQ